MSAYLFVYSTYERARRKFNQFLSLHDPKDGFTVSVSPSRLRFEMNSNTYEFAWLDDIQNKIAGKTFSDIIVDELVTLTPEQSSLLLTRKRIG
jgi:hypothetical protein